MLMNTQNQIARLTLDLKLPDFIQRDYNKTLIYDHSSGVKKRKRKAGVKRFQTATKETAAHMYSPALPGYRDRPVFAE